MPFHLPDAEDVAAARVGKPLPKCADGKTRLDVAEASRKADERALETWKKAVRARDGKLCRCCKRKVVVTLKLQASRAETHHITGRVHKPTRYDVRNGLQLCCECHRKVERNEIQIVGTAEFQIGNRSYIDADHHVDFKELA